MVKISFELAAAGGKADKAPLASEPNADADILLTPAPVSGAGAGGVGGWWWWWEQELPSGERGIGFSLLPKT